jgi:beta-N-acetylhexosaminidase
MSEELERLAATCLFPGFAGLELSDDLRRLLEAGIGGVVLFARNVRDMEQLAALTASLHAERPDLLVAVDEEGGDVTRLEAARGSSYPGNLALGAVDDVALTEQVAQALGSDLAAVGIDLDLAPVADLNSNPANPVIGVRSFGSEPELVARHVAAFVSGLQRTGVAACAKHFPGHGDTAQDSHLELPVVAGRVEDALRPFRSAVAAGVRAIMTAHVRVPELGDMPATMNSRVLQALLRGELRFTGLVITDALEMRAISETVGVERAAAAALAAGADALCLGRDLAAEPVKRAVVASVASGRIDESRLEDAAARVRDTARWVARAAPESNASREIGAAAARRALDVHGSVALSRPPLVVELQPTPSLAAGEAGRGLGEALRTRVPDAEVVRVSEEPAAAKAIVRERRGRQLVVVLRDAHRHEWQRATAESLLADTDDAILVETGLPRWRPSAPGYVATRGAGRVNLEAAADLLVAT